jgi:hypothetical protein
MKRRECLCTAQGGDVMTGKKLDTRSHSIGGWLRAAVSAWILLLLLVATPALADYVGGLNPNGDNYLSLRDGPGTGYGEVLRMDSGTVVTVLERQGDWRLIRLEDGTTGWAFARYLKAGLPPGYEPEPSFELGKHWSKWRDDSAGVAVEYPADLFTPGEPTESGSVLFTADAIEATMEVRTIENVDGLDPSALRGILLRKGEKASYSAPLPNGFVVSGRDGRTIFYRKALLSDDESIITVLELVYPGEMKAQLDWTISRISTTLVAAVRLPTGIKPAQPPGDTQSATSEADAELERLRLQAEIERLQLEKLKLAQQSSSSEVEPTPPGGQNHPVTPAGRRVALVIGNGAYLSLTPLPTPASDARALAERLAQLGYDVSLGVDKDRQQMAEMLAQFYTKAEGADVALFYYSGHGMQIEGRNYLLPTDAAFANEAAFLDVDARAFDLQKFIAVSSMAHVSIVFVDACRDNPILEKSIVSTLFKGTSSSMTKGLAVVQRESLNSGQFVGFAAEPGKTAETGTGKVSVYTQALLKELQEPGLDVSIMHRRIRTDVEAATNGRQSPRYVDDLADAFALNSAP